MYEDTLYSKLMNHSIKGAYPFHMPGHKRSREFNPGVNPYQIDITEIDGFDDLHHPSGIIKEAQEKAAKLFGAEESHFLVNGCTGGILAAIMTCVNNGKTLIMGRNSHKSAYNAVITGRIKPAYIWPKQNGYIFGGITKEQVNDAIAANPDAEAVFITSPTYEGVVSDIKGIAEVCHAHNIPLIVDEAHGAHMSFAPIFPESAVSQGADIVINGIHKTLPSLTQTALLHVCGQLINRKKLKTCLTMFQSSSPSYVLMGSIDYCMTYLCHEAVQQYKIYQARLVSLYEELMLLKYIYVLPYGKKRDASKIVVCTEWSGMTGKECYDILKNKHNLMAEMCSLYHVVIMTSAWDLKDVYDNLIAALYDIDNECENRQACPHIVNSYPNNEMYCTPGEAFYNDELPDDVSGDLVYVYPPGIPIIVPGEVISEDTVTALRTFGELGYEIHGGDF